MNILNIKVNHVQWGIGTIIDQDPRYIIVEFPHRKSKFPYPEGFKKHLKAEDLEIQSKIRDEIKRLEDAAALELKHRQEEEQRNREEKRLNDVEKQTRKSKGTSQLIKPITSRVEGQAMIFLVFQGATYDKALQCGCIWAPLYNAQGGTYHYWDRLLDVRKGDIILHCSGGYIKAISVARGTCVETENPEGINDKQDYQKKVRRVDCDYAVINKPIKTADFKEDILKYCNVKYAPFDKTGNGNMGYLFEINRHLAQLFIEKSIKQNDYLLNLDYVQELLR